MIILVEFWNLVSGGAQHSQHALKIEQGFQVLTDSILS
jgi:hypothetical protein